MPSSACKKKKVLQVFALVLVSAVFAAAVFRVAPLLVSSQIPCNVTIGASGPTCAGAAFCGTNALPAAAVGGATATSFVVETGTGACPSAEPATASKANDIKKNKLKPRSCIRINLPEIETRYVGSLAEHPGRQISLDFTPPGKLP